MSVIGDWFSNSVQGISNWWNDTARPFLRNLWNGFNNSYLDPSGFNAEQAQLDRDWQEQMMHFQNSYNSPEQQMQRARDAGLNPSMLYGQPIETSASPSGGAKASAMTGAFNPLDIFNAIQQKKLVDAQVENINADTLKKDAETEEIGYRNAVELALQKIPIGHVAVQNENGETEYEVIYGNYHVKLAERQLHAVGLSTQGLQYQLNDLYYNLAVLTGSDSFPNDISPIASNTPNFEAHSAGLKGDLKVRKLSAEMAEIGYDAAKAEKAGREAYSKWLDANKDKPAVQVALAIQGFLQTLGLSLPSFGHREGGYMSGGQFHKTSSSWYFGK